MRIKAGIPVVAALGVAALSGCSADGGGAETDRDAAPAEQVSPAPPTESADDAAEESIDDAAEESMERTGRVVVSGPEGLRMVSLYSEDGQSVGLTGSLLDELMRVSGAVVRVTGTAAETMGREGVDVTRYEIVSVDGERPLVGVLGGGGGSFRLQGDQPVGLVDVPDELAGQVGALIWVTGPDTPDGRRVQSYGVIRPAG
jgi:hypothetical protein